MVDFAKLALSREREWVTYRCRECGEEYESAPLPEHMLVHYFDRAMRRCGGAIAEVSRRTEGRGIGQGRGGSEANMRTRSGARGQEPQQQSAQQQESPHEPDTWGLAPPGARPGLTADPTIPAPTLGDEQRVAQELAEQRSGEEAFAAAAGGDVVEVTWGEELFQPVQYNSFRVGPFKATTRIRSGESIAQATVRLHAEIERAARQIAQEKARAYGATLAAAISTVSNGRIS